MSSLCLAWLAACGPEAQEPAAADVEAPAGTSQTVAAPLASPLPRLRVSGNGRFLVKEDNTPFFYLGDTAWQLLPWLNRADTVKYLDSRAALGFNVIQATVVASMNGLGPNQQGDAPFASNNFAAPVVTPGNNPSNATEYDFWDHVDFVVNEAEARGIYMALLPAWGDYVNAGFLNLNNAQAYGQFLGNRYKDKRIIWVLGGDKSPAGYESVWRAVARGIAIGVSGTEDYSQVLMTYHPPGRQKSSTWFHNEPWLDFNMQQNGHCPNTEVWTALSTDYALTPTKPTLDGEPIYEQIVTCLTAGNPLANDYEVRKYAYWSVFAGAFGHTYGHNSVWQMYAPGRTPQFGAKAYWYDALGFPGATQMQYLRRLIESRPGLLRIPDQGLLSSSAGTGTNRIQATRGSDSSYAFVYSASGQAFTVNMSRISGGTVRATWYSPRNGQTQGIGDFPNTGTRQFTPPGSGAGNDWVLLLDDASKGYPLPGTTTPPPTEGYTTQAASASPATVAPGQKVTLSVSFRAAAAASGRNVKLDVKNASGSSVAGLPFGNQGFAAGETKTYPLEYTVPVGLAQGTYCLAAGVASADWLTWYHYDNCAASFTVSHAPVPTVGFTLVSASTSPAVVSRGGTVRLSSTFQANAAVSAVNVKLDVRDATGTSTVASHPIVSQAFTQGQTRTFQVDYGVPSTLSPGTYCLATGVVTLDWSPWYVWNSCAAKFTVQ